MVTALSLAVSQWRCVQLREDIEKPSNFAKKF